MDEKNKNGGVAVENSSGEKSDSRNADKETQKFDWVTARSACTLPKIFKELRLHIEQDVATRNSLRIKSAPYEFSVGESEGGFKVLLKSEAVSLAVTFVLAEHAILVRDNTGTSMFDIALKFTEQGECKLVVNGEERGMWQVQRMALEDLMFRSLR